MLIFVAKLVRKVLLEKVVVSLNSAKIGVGSLHLDMSFAGSKQH